MSLLKVNDSCEFRIDGKIRKGVVAIVDKYGIFGDNSKPYYDIFCDGVLYKHVPSTAIVEKILG